ncbi:MAG: hypothetical protein A4S09_08390 [Proteobacteria bacterium SG_bin7]|nr:MAG: hypothetical protein A4S09_08390 [Proteobacteria bacterium SG_bin7]
MNLTTEVLKKSNTTPWQEMDDQILVLMPKQNTVHELNATASFLWKNIDGELSIKDLTDLLVEEFDVTLETAQKDIQDFITEMKTQGLLSVVI